MVRPDRRVVNVLVAKGVGVLCLLGVAGLVAGAAGCDVVPRRTLSRSREAAEQLEQRAAAAEAELDTALADRDAALLAVQQAQGLAEQARLSTGALAADRDAALAAAAESDRLAAKLQANLTNANARLANLAGERGELQTRFIGLLRDVGGPDGPLATGPSRRFEELAARYPEFDFDPATGVTKFAPEVYFDTGKADIRGESVPLLRRLAGILTTPGAEDLRVLVVGHTDDEKIAGGVTKIKHPTNYHLATNRANEVAVTLTAAGVAGARIGTAGYGPHQPAVRNADDFARAKNRRVEIYVLAPDTKIAGLRVPAARL